MPKITKHRNGSGVSLTLEGALIIDLADLLDALDLGDTMIEGKEDRERMAGAQTVIRTAIRDAYGY